MQIKYLAGAAVLAVALPFATVADSEDKADHYIQTLNLDDARAEQVRDIMENYHDGKKALKDQKKQQLEEVLTDDEMEKLKSMKESKREKYDR